MKKGNIKLYGLIAAVMLLGPMGCKEELNLDNPNAPTLAGSVVDESGFVSFIQGGIYNVGFSRGADWLGDSYFSLPWGYHELMADNIGASASNNQITNIAQPLSITLDDASVLNNPAKQVDIIRVYNSRAASGAGNNLLYYQWGNMYALNNACNQILANTDHIQYNMDKATSIATIQAFCYWWKGYAYAGIGSLYVSGIIADDASPSVTASTKITNDYVDKSAIIARSNYYFNLAITTLQTIKASMDLPTYNSVLGELIPSICQVGNGGVMDPDMFIRNINTMLARNILVNKLSTFVNGVPGSPITKSLMTPMQSADWASILTLTTNGVQQGDKIFTARSTAISSNTIFTATSGNVAAQTAAKASSSTFKISERFLSYLSSRGDARFVNNFNTSSAYTDNYAYTTRYTMVNGGTGANSSYVYGNRTPGAYEVVIASSYEENELMKAEANIQSGNIDLGVASIDAVRTYMGAGLAPIGNGKTLAQALTELVSERRVSLAFRGLSFYDNRRYGWSYDVSLGGGNYKQVVIHAGTVNTNATINYNFLDYWDIPADETVLNPPSASSAPITNPNY
ncbi:MAG: RagB/SusD family nutrient uptake outer membrane protein [Cytophagales bacterium]|jgi:hypothetical protein|nr:hypothetical protein [Bacteroidota bacterium]MBS1982498.1 hypothetical protein [Bacteroidota bacterium]WHZ06360.1 MAG: RagB/SusD family nutrient uptake outer membrane protein [Cytophagales bacterium]